MYHKVRVSYLGKYRTYEIYKGNEVYLKPAYGCKISKRQATAIVNLLNHL